jgi:hypothetical protein
MIMSRIRQRYDEEFRKNAVKLSYATSKTIKTLAMILEFIPALSIAGEKFIPNMVTKTKVAEQQGRLKKAPT